MAVLLMPKAGSLQVVTWENRPMTDLVEFLRARLDEDEAVARAAAPPPWNAFIGSVTSGAPPNDEEFCDLIPPGESKGDDASAAHIARHDPARVLREVEAKRQIVERCERELRDYVGTGAQAALPYLLLRALARPYADHPDYDSAWAVIRERA
jgi:hypothetical protein